LSLASKGKFHGDELTFHYCGVNHSHFKVGETLKGVVMDWSDTEA